jgi:hypothetical protein
VVLLSHGKDIFAVCWRTAVFVGTAKNIFPVVTSAVVPLTIKPHAGSIGVVVAHMVKAGIPTPRVHL